MKKKYRKLKKKLALLKKENEKLLVEVKAMRWSALYRKVFGIDAYHALGSERPVDRLVAPKEFKKLTVTPIDIFNTDTGKTRHAHSILAELTDGSTLSFYP